MTIVVIDLEEAKQFFELLGFEVDLQVTVSGESMSKYMGIADWKADHVTLVLRDTAPRQEVQLLRFYSPSAIVDNEAERLDRTGFEVMQARLMLSICNPNTGAGGASPCSCSGISAQPPTEPGGRRVATC